MNNFIEIRHIDRAEVDYLVRNLEDFEKDKAVRDGLFSAGNVFKIEGRKRLRQSMKSGSRGVTGNLLKSFQVKVKKNKPGVLTGFKQGKDGGSHAHLVDLGTTERFYTTKKGSRKSTGKVIGNLFWSDTEAQDYPKAMNELYKGIERGVNKITSRR